MGSRSPTVPRGPLVRNLSPRRPKVRTDSVPDTFEFFQRIGETPKLKEQTF